MALLSFDQQDFLRTRAFLQRYDLKRGATPELLGVAARTEYALGNHEGAVEFARRVVQEFTASKEADLFANWQQSIQNQPKPKSKPSPSKNPTRNTDVWGTRGS